MLFDDLLMLSAKETISDFLIKEGDSLWARKAGVLTRQETEPVTRDQIVELIKKNESHTGVKASKIQEILEVSGDKDFALKIGSKRFRANLYWCNGQRLSMAVRQLPDTAPHLAKLNLPSAYLDLLSNSKGLILVTGATGSGKTTTLASTLEFLNSNTTGHIITLEDPVEYLIRSKRCLVDQRQIGRDVVSFSQGLRSSLRQDPDILLVGELRDYETVKTALDAANTGHLVLATLHTNSAQQTLERLTSFFSDDMRDWAHAVVSQALLGILSQVLVPRLDGQDRVLAAELLVNSPDVRQIIREGRSHQLFNAMDTGSSRGQVLLNKVLLDLSKKNVIGMDAALYAAYDPAALKKEFSRA